MDLSTDVLLLSTCWSGLEEENLFYNKVSFFYKQHRELLIDNLKNDVRENSFVPCIKLISLNDKIKPILLS